VRPGNSGGSLNISNILKFGIVPQFIKTSWHQIVVITPLIPDSLLRIDFLISTVKFINTMTYKLVLIIANLVLLYTCSHRKHITKVYTYTKKWFKYCKMDYSKNDHTATSPAMNAVKTRIF
jgi:hypothetical protein